MIFKVTVSYDGWNYAGWQRQENALGVQEIIEKVLTKINKNEITIVASGRTDAKVHALGQVFHFESIVEMPCENYRTAMNTLLPSDIRILKVENVADDFHARFSAKSKRYDYICSYDIDNPFIYKYKEILWYPHDIELMRKASQYLIGEHDFTSFSSSKIDPRKPRVKTITRIDILEEENGFRTIFEGTGFLRYQVRMMMGTLLAVGRKKIEPIKVKEILDAQNKEACRYNAGAQGLYLMEVNYV